MNTPRTSESEPLGLVVYLECAEGGLGVWGQTLPDADAFY